MDYIDYKFVQMVGSRLERFHDTGNRVYAFRCPICGDSQKDKRKTRGYLLWRDADNETQFFCHNCGSSMGLAYFLKEVASDLYTSYRVEKFGYVINKKVPEESIEKALISSSPQAIFNNPLLNCQTLREATGDNIAIREYAESRLIPDRLFDDLYATPDVNNITKRLEKFKDTEYPKTPMLVMPFYRKDGSYSYIQCRAADPNASSDFRFLTLKIDEVGPKLYGEKYVDWSKPTYVLEGPIDAMFIENGVANAGASTSMSYVVSNCMDRGAPRSNICMLFDNDYTINTQVMAHVQRAVATGYSVVLFDDEFEGYKDINKAITSGWSISDVNYYIRKRTFSGLRAKLELSNIGKRY